MNYYDKWCPRFAQSNCLKDRETHQKYVAGTWVKIRTKDNEFRGIISYVGTKYLLIPTGPLKDGKRSCARVEIAEIVSVERIDALWDEPEY